MTITRARTVVGTRCLLTIACLLAAPFVSHAQEQDSANTIRIPKRMDGVAGLDARRTAI